MPARKESFKVVQMVKRTVYWFHSSAAVEYTWALFLNDFLTGRTDCQRRQGLAS
jgi:hypothetical protein